ncbi:MAG TPA: ACT domain-containing protein [Sedimentibacter sp.]|jgi:chorismate mutase|nr:ACT domain-containing protein [Sedimentibacter sp.]HHZ01210.1 ACT domain-containing protein [Tissierellia bacterium]HOK49281.1 ACT domain-containing protein [Sedimentibacter sp.]HOW23189.1 ACT domain-containing protein [Sedimentibacter sp.]HRC79842.1 ACT domain-containing protein [Sedimentibacter sp.]
MKNYLIVSKKILPDVYEKVIEARNLINSGSAKSISEAVKAVGISRSTYYKYKDFVFSPDENSIGRKAVVSMMLKHEKGVLSNVLNYLSQEHANILTINQSIPINGKASVNVSLDISDLSKPIDEVVAEMKKLKGTTQVKLLSVE